MSRLPRVTGRQVVVALRRAGFEVVRTKGSHHFLRHGDGRIVVVPVHAGEDLGPGLLSAILHSCKLTREEFGRLL
ncbi:MAG: type II toxin-antitoxin system HicA family toxin [Chloroflexota bacterium]